MDVVPRQPELLEVRAHRLRRNPFVPQRLDGRARSPFRDLAAVRAENQAVVDELRRRRPERLEQPPMERLVGAMVVAADDVRDAEVDVVDNRRELIGRRAVLAHQRETVEPVAERCPHVAMALRALALTHGPLVPGKPEPFQIPHDRLLPAGDVARGIGVVDPEQHPVAKPPVRDRAQRVADVKRARRARRKADSDHRASVSGAPLGDRAEQLGCPGAEAVRMLFLEHGAERPDLPLVEAHVPGLEREAQLERELSVALGDVGASSGRRGERAHDVAWNPDDLAVEIDPDHFVSHGLSMAFEG